MSESIVPFGLQSLDGSQNYCLKPKYYVHYVHETSLPIINTSLEARGGHILCERGILMNVYFDRFRVDSNIWVFLGCGDLLKKFLGHTLSTLGFVSEDALIGNVNVLLPNELPADDWESKFDTLIAHIGMWGYFEVKTVSGCIISRGEEFDKSRFVSK